MSNFNRYRDSSMPELAPATCSLLEVIWEDDYESFGLLNPVDDEMSFDLVKKLDELVRRHSLPVLADEVGTALRENGWTDLDEDDLGWAEVGLLADAGALRIMDDLWMLWNDE